MLTSSNNSPERKIEHNFLSQVGIRNAEVAGDLLRSMELARNKYRPGNKGIIGILADFYKTIIFVNIIRIYLCRNMHKKGDQNYMNTKRICIKK